jgi:Cys-tRNA(Pro)/Cys-tRNA(Cys) deacylase
MMRRSEGGRVGEAVHENVEAVLEGSGVLYQVHLHQDMPFPIRSPDDFARALGYDMARITKTLLLRATDGQEFCLVVLSSNKNTDLARVAELLGVKRVQMAAKEDLTRVLGHPPTGVSPIGAGSIPVLLDEGIMEFPSVLVGAGEVGTEIEISPAALEDVTDGVTVRVAM